MRHAVVAALLLLSSCKDGVRVTSQTSGLVEAVFVEEGSHVRTGDVLIQFDTHDTLLRRSRIITCIDVAELRRADASGLYRELETVNVDLARMTITAPADGRVVWLAKVRAGESVRRGELLALVKVRTEFPSGGHS
jgi:multidrug resistance efflux pump